MFAACNSAATQAALHAKFFEEEQRRKRAAEAARPKRKQGWFKPGSPEALAQQKEKEAAKRESLNKSERSTVTASSSSAQDQEDTAAEETSPLYAIINKERHARKLESFSKDEELEILAKSVLDDIVRGHQPKPMEYHGNVGIGLSLSQIHETMMKDRQGPSRQNILSPSQKFTHIGAAETTGPGGNIYAVTLFR